MKVESTKTAFHPITITLQTEEEARALYQLTNMTNTASLADFHTDIATKFPVVKDAVLEVKAELFNKLWDVLKENK